MKDRRPPNFLIFCADQMRADHLGCAGNPVIRTPNLDRLAAGGVHLERAYVNNPLCMPSRSTMLTGQAPRGHRVRTNGIDLDPNLPTMPAALAAAGYRTHSVGKIHARCYGVGQGMDAEKENPRDWPECAAMWRSGRIRRLPAPYYGFQGADLTIGHGTWVKGDYGNWLKRKNRIVYEKLGTDFGEKPASGAEQCLKSALPEELHHSAWVADRAIDFLNGSDDDRPFFLWCSFPDPHHPYVPPRPWADMYDGFALKPAHRRAGELRSLPPFYRKAHESNLQLSGRFEATRASDAQLRDIIALTYSMISLMDHHIGRVMTALEALGLRENTVVAFLSDHGDMMGDHWMLNKGPFHFDGLLRVPMIWSWPGKFPRNRKSPALASLLDLVPTILDLAGVAPLEGPTPPAAEAPRQRPALPGRSLAPLLRGKAKSVQDSVVIENDEDYLGLQLRTLITDRHKITAYPGQPFGELFDLRADPHETRNLWRSREGRSLRGDLLCRLLERLVETDSALPRRMSHA